MKRSLLAGLLFSALLLTFGFGIGHRAAAQSQPTPVPQMPFWMASVLRQAAHAPLPVDPTLAGKTPAVISQTLATANPSGTLTSYQPAGDTKTSSNAYFTSLGSNGRTCFTCHQPQAGWSMNPQTAAAQFIASQARDPLFAPVDGANCPDLGAAAHTLTQKMMASSQLLSKGNIRVFLPIPANAQYKLKILHDPYGCENSPTYGLPTGGISMYRRVMNSANLAMNGQFVSGSTTINSNGAIMWDGREPSLESQFNDATLGHAQALKPPSAEQIAQGVAFERGLYAAQSYDNTARSLTAAGASGGPVALSADEPVVNAAGKEGMNMFDAWAGSSQAARASISRGQDIFNNRQFTTTGVAGLNDTRGNPATATCAGCHSNQNVGSSVNAGGKHLGIGDNSSADQSGNQTAATFLPPSVDQPLFSFLCPRDVNGKSIIPFFSNPVTIDGVTYDDFQTSDPGMGLITGKCADLGKFKVPRLRELAARAPYFHGGNAASIQDVVEFYNTRFNLGFTDQEKQDLINFLNTL